MSNVTFMFYRRSYFPTLSTDYQVVCSQEQDILKCLIEQLRYPDSRSIKVGILVFCNLLAFIINILFDKNLASE